MFRSALKILRKLLMALKWAKEETLKDHGVGTEGIEEALRDAEVSTEGSEGRLNVTFKF